MTSVQHSIPPSRREQEDPPQDPQLAGQHLKPDASAIPPATLHASAASFLRTSSIAATRHGGTPHSTCASTILSPQQASLPPGRCSHSIPPQAPQEAEQQICPKGSGIPPTLRHASETDSTRASESDAPEYASPGADPGPPPAFMVQGACVSTEHILSCADTWSKQQLCAPPGADSHSGPPHVTHDAAQHCKLPASMTPLNADAHASTRCTIFSTMESSITQGGSPHFTPASVTSP
mmetsp:Transcript_68200/g.110652  ORF Transcript_68200/g.110652 Transcript_68200/m.110652 type:complete len:236 (+) Transcript_68200:2661-3368(+)